MYLETLQGMKDAESNVQLMIYGLGVLDMLGFLYDINTVELTIVQPRIEHFSTWEISAEDLFSWGKDVFEPGAARALAGEGEFKAGDHCRFCKARVTCRARAEEYLKLAQMEFAEPALMSDEEIAEGVAHDRTGDARIRGEQGACYPRHRQGAARAYRQAYLRLFTVHALHSELS